MTEELQKSITGLSKKINLQKTPAFDHTRNIIIAGVNAIPLCGGSLASLLTSYIPSRKVKRTLDFIQSLSDEIDKVKDKINEDLINKDEFSFIFEKTFIGVSENYQKEKIDCYKAIFINALTNKDLLPDEEKEVCINILNSLTVRHLRILSIINANRNGDLMEIVNRNKFGYNSSDVMYIMDDLRNKGLVFEKGSVGIDFNLRHNFNQLSKTGIKFMHFITLTKSPNAG